MAKLKTTCFLLCLLLALVSIARPNSAPVTYHGLDGTDVVLLKNKQIRMVREVINIDCAWDTYTVQADFWFKNTTSKAQAVQFGFPIDYEPDNSRFDDEGFERSKQSFKVEWKGKRIAFKVGKPQDGEESGEKRLWISWNAQFAPAEEVHHRVRYTFATSRSDFEGNRYARLTYILKTGAFWNAPIESTTVNLSYNHPMPSFFGGDGTMEPDPAHLSFSPDGYSWNREQKKVTWEFRNYVPTKNIYFTWQPPDDSGRQRFLGYMIFVFLPLLVLLLAVLAITIIGYLAFKWLRKRRKLKEAMSSPAQPIEDAQEQPASPGKGV